LVIWSADAAKADWVMDEAERAREQHKLVQVRLDKTRLPMLASAEARLKQTYSPGDRPAPE
jgi:hypothetical protein